MGEYKFYRSLVTGGGYVPQGDCQATLTLDDNRNPTWTDMADEFRELCLPWFGNSVVMSVLNDMPEFTPYSDEALEQISKHQLPSQGYIMMTIKSAKRAKEKPKDEPKEPVKETKPVILPGFAPQQFFHKPTITHNKLPTSNMTKQEEPEEN